jgi:hypothetical protein
MPLGARIALATALIITGAVIGWGLSATLVERAVASEQALRGAAESVASAKAALVGSYEVTGTDPDGVPYGNKRVVDITLTPSGALELDWNDGTFVGVGQVVDNILAVSYSVKGRNVIAIMTINSDGTLSGNWLRRTDRGSKGRETWTRVKV